MRKPRPKRLQQMQFRSFFALLPAMAMLGCGTSTPTVVPVPSSRVEAAIAAWGEALRAGDVDAVNQREDAAGRFAFVYVATKALAGQVPGGAKAVEQTIVGHILGMVLAALGGYSDRSDLAIALPPGALATALVTMGLANGGDGTPFVQLPREETTKRLEDASAHQRQRLREVEAWTCRPLTIERTLPAPTPSMMHAAELSQHIFKWWLDTVDYIWVVRVVCQGGSGLVVVVGHPPKRGHPIDDKILVTVLDH